MKTKKLLTLPALVLGMSTLSGCSSVMPTVTWVNWDGTVLEVDKHVVIGEWTKYDGEKPTKPSTAQYDYVFAGWDLDTTHAGRVYKDRTITAQFKEVLRKYDITWVVDGESTVQKVSYGTTPKRNATKPQTDEYKYSFTGWLAEDGTVGVKEVTGDATYVAQFDSIKRQYNVKFLNWDGKVLQSSNVEYGTMPTFNRADPTKPKTDDYLYEFVGWFNEYNVEGLKTVTGAQVYQAVFVPVERTKAKIEYYRLLENGSVVPYSNSSLKTIVPYGDNLDLPKFDGGDGYSLTWFTDIDCETKAPATVRNVQSDLVFFGKPQYNTYTISYEGLDVVPSAWKKTYTVGSDDIVLEDPEEREGYVFKGYYVDGERLDDNTFVCSEHKENVTIEAKWDERSDRFNIVFNANFGYFPYTLTFRDGTSLVSTHQITKETAPVEFPILENTADKQFAGWGNWSSIWENGLVVNGDRTLYANWVNLEENSIDFPLNTETDVPLHGINSVKLQYTSLIDQYLTEIEVDSMPFGFARLTKDDTFITFHEEDDKFVFNEPIFVTAGETFVIEFQGKTTAETSFKCTIKSDTVEHFGAVSTNDENNTKRFFNCLYNSRLQDVGTPVREGYRFTGWYNEAVGRYYQIGELLKEDNGTTLVLKANWELIGN